MTFADLQAAIDAAVAANGGPFRRIVLISHAGGPANGPSADLGTERLTAANLKAKGATKNKSALSVSSAL